MSCSKLTCLSSLEHQQDNGYQDLLDMHPLSFYLFSIGSSLCLSEQEWLYSCTSKVAKLWYHSQGIHQMYLCPKLCLAAAYSINLWAWPSVDSGSEGIELTPSSVPVSRPASIMCCCLTYKIKEKERSSVLWDSITRALPQEQPGLLLKSWMPRIPM